MVITKTWKVWEEKERGSLIMRTQTEGILFCVTSWRNCDSPQYIQYLMENCRRTQDFQT